MHQTLPCLETGPVTSRRVSMLEIRKKKVQKGKEKAKPNQWVLTEQNAPSSRKSVNHAKGSVVGQTNKKNEDIVKTWHGHDSHNIHLTPLTTPLPTPRKMRKIMTTNHTYHMKPTRSHSTVSHMPRRTQRSLRRRLRSIFSIMSTTCLTLSG